MNAFALLPKTSRRQLLASALLAAGVMGLPGGAAWAQGGAKGGAANLATSVLYYDALVSRAHLAHTLDDLKDVDIAAWNEEAKRISNPTK